MIPVLGAPSMRARLAPMVIATSVLAASASLHIRGTKEPGLILLQASANYVSNNKPDPNPPRMLVAEGCDGSTAILLHARNILSFHGINTGDNLQKELLDKPRNPFITKSNDDMDVAMAKLHNQYRQKDVTLMFKSILHRDLKATLSPGLVKLGTLAAYSTRRNQLDQVVCMVRDCFLDTDEKTTIWGYPVTADGTPSRMCFDRREKAGTGASTGTTAYLQLKRRIKGRSGSLLGEHLDFFQNQTTTGLAKLKAHGYHPAKVTYEDLVAFQESENNIKTSLKAWTSLLQAWGVTANEEKLTKYFQRQAGTWQQIPHKDTIYNWQEVRAELKKLGRLDLFRD